jgi:hypothetical protein
MAIAYFFGNPFTLSGFDTDKTGFGHQLYRIRPAGPDSKGNFITDKKNGCIVWYKIGFPEDSVTGSGGCKDQLADGYGTLVGFTRMSI